MKKFLKVRSVAIAIMVTLAATAFVGCNQESLSAPSSTVSEVRQDEKSKAESKVESSKDEKSKAEKSEVETSVEPSKSESSVEESSREVSKVESSVQVSVEPSETSSDSVSVKDAVRYGRVSESCPMDDLEDLSSFSKMVIIPSDSLIVILNINDLSAYENFYTYETYEVLYAGKKYVVAADDVELFSEDYMPDFTDEHWFGID